MRATRVDQIVKILSVGSTRRGVLAFLSTLPLLGGLDAFLADDAAEAQGRRRRRK